MEWSEVVRSTTVEGTDWLLCETLLFELFEFSPQLVGEGCDDVVQAYEIAYEDSQKVSWREQEVARLHSALSERGQLGELPPCSAHRSPCFVVAPSQFHVKATVIGSSTPDKRRDLQERIQQKLLGKLDAWSQGQQAVGGAGCKDGPERNTWEKPTTNVADDRQNPLQRWWQKVRANFNKGAEVEMTRARQTVAELPTENACIDAESPAMHTPELCVECIRMGAWCCGSPHLLGVTPCLDAAVALMQSNVRWLPCEAGVEAEVEYEDERVLLQIRPRLFFILDADAKLFG